MMTPHHVRVFDVVIIFNANKLRSSGSTSFQRVVDKCRSNGENMQKYLR